jgi:putative spermidine/putrescine transport system substrate-binding protein
MPHRPGSSSSESATSSRIPRKAALAALVALAGCGREQPPAADLARAPWAEVEKAAQGQTVTWMMWQGDPYINAYVQSYVAPQLQKRYGITLNTVSGQGGDIVAALMTEKESGKAKSEMDLMWINGETFYQLRQIDALQGPFTDRLPNARLIDFSNPFIKYDFQQEVHGYECPWGNVQLALIYDTKRVTDPPRTRQALLAWVRAHPGRFTFDTAFTGMTFLKSLLIDIAGGPIALAGPFDRAKYDAHSAALWAYVKELKPFLWKKGETYPISVAQLHQLFTSGEVDFTMSNNDGDVDNKVLQGLFPDTARAYVLDDGTIQNTHYVGIPRRARNLAGALVTANFLISPEAQFEKAKPSVWGDGTVLALPLLEKEWQERFRNIPERTHSPTRESIQPKALQELAPEYMIRLYEDFRKNVLGT